MTNGMVLRDAVLSAANAMQNEKNRVNALNIFPVPDGDTGTNMSLTIRAAANALLANAGADPTVGEVAEICASAMLRGARGNSGVILSLIFGGMAAGFKGCVEANGATIATALELGRERAYKTVMNPSEGTILTVIRFSADKAREKALAGADTLDVWRAVCVSADDALARTQYMLPVLKKAQIVDAGASGLVIIFKSMLAVFEGGAIVALDEPGAAAPAADSANVFATVPDEEIKYHYCTEFLIQKNEDCGDGAAELRSWLSSIGDCVVVVDDDDIIKVHCHSNIPGEVISRATAMGELINIKIDNMAHQHRKAAWGVYEGKVIEAKKQTPPAEPVREFGFVVVAYGKGMTELFEQLGADVVVSGGQTMNPSTEEILDAAERTPASTVFVLPNNKNIILAAQSAIALCSKKLVVLDTTTVPQGITAMLRFDPDADEKANTDAMTAAFKRVSTVQVTYAARDSTVNGEDIRQGQILALENGRITEIGDDPVEAAFRAVKHLAKRDTSVVTIYYGEGVTSEKALELRHKIDEKLPDAEVVSVNGGQPVYYYIISLEE